MPRARRAALGAGAYGRMFEVMALTTTATNTVPAFLGQASGVVLMAERAGIGVAASLAVLAQHQAVEGVAKVATLLLAAAIAPLPPRAHRTVVAFTVGTAALLVVLLVVARRTPRAPHAGVPHTRRRRLRQAVATWAVELEALREPRRLAMGLAIALLMKLAEAGGHAAVLRALDVRAPVGTPVVALAAVNLASSVAASPGNVGTYEAGAVFAYRRMGIAPDRAAALALAAHLCYLAPLVGMGWVVLGVRQVAGRKGRASEAARVRGGE